MKIFFISLGCDKNLVDSEHMLGLLEDADDITITDDETQAEIIIINTCCFIGDAKEESIQTILDMAEYKKHGALKGLIVTGCLAERYREEIKEELPEVDAVIGTNSYDSILEAVRQVSDGVRYENFKPLDGICAIQKRMLSTGGHYAYLKIAEGCNKHCSYCIIPKIRGAYRSVPMEMLLQQADRLVMQGVKELILVAQETTLYGIDLYGKKSLAALLDQLNRIEGLVWIRILYCYPEEIDDELIDAIVRNPKVCHYLDIPIQHSSDIILKRMGRKTSRADLISMIQKLREKIPDICLRTTLICGFPGETQKEHEELMQFINDMEFDRLGAFTYSPEEGTLAETFQNQIEEEQKLCWKEQIMELQQEISFDKNEELKGKELSVFIEGKVADENAYLGRTYRDAPGVDGYVFINTTEILMTGDFVKAKITGAYEYDLIGELIP